MKVTPAIVQGEFIGVDARIAKSTQPASVGMKGKVIDETRNTFMMSYDKQKKTIIKDTAIFHFTLHDGTVIEIDGKLLVGRPEDRVKKQIRRLW
jgi:ribonuclease P protein subunit POP4